MRRLMLVAAVLILPFALAIGGHNGATALGVTLTLGYLILTVWGSPSRRQQ